MGLIPYSLFILLIVSCGSDMEKVRFFDRKTLPTQTIVDGVIVRSSMGNRQMRMEAPLIESYDNPEHKTVYPQGVSLTFFEGGSTKPKVSLKAGYAVSYDDKRRMEARDSVVIIDFGTGDTTYLTNIIWDQNEQRIFSQKPVRSVNGPRVTLGDGFESDENFVHPLIYHQRGTIEWNE